MTRLPADFTPLRRPVLVAAFEGWNDAGDAASDAVEHLRSAWDGTEVVPALTPDQFHGPGIAHTGYGEYNQRELLNRWADDIEAPMQAASTLEVGGGRQVALGEQSAGARTTAGQSAEQLGAQA